MISKEQRSKQDGYDGTTRAMWLIRNNEMENLSQWEHDPNIQDKRGWTVLMYLAWYRKHLLKQWYHDPSIQNEEGNTVAMILAGRGVIPSQKWQHDPTLRNVYGQTVAMILAQTRVILPKNIGGTLSCSGKRILGQWDHDPSLNFGNGTVAMHLAQRNIIPPKEWEHDPSIQDRNGMTCAMILAEHKNVPPKQWQHDPSIMSKYRGTVAMILAQHKITPPKQWEHDPSICNNMHGTCYKIMKRMGMKKIQSFWKADHQQYINYINRKINKRYIKLIKLFPIQMKVLKKFTKLIQ